MLNQNEEMNMEAQSQPEGENTELLDDISNNPEEAIQNMRDARNAFLQYAEEQNSPEDVLNADPIEEMIEATVVETPPHDNTDITSVIENAIANMQRDMPQVSQVSQDPVPEVNTNNATKTPEPDGFKLDDIAMPNIESDEFYEKFTQNPGEAIMEIAKAISNEQLKPIVEQLQPLMKQSEIARRNEGIKQAANTFAQQYGDFERYQPDIVRRLKEGQFAMDNPESYERAYKDAKISALEAENQNLSSRKGLSDYLGDEAYLGEIANNESVKQTVIANYLKELQNGSNPQVISGQSSAPIAQNVNEPGDIKSAGKMFAKSLLQ